MLKKVMQFKIQLIFGILSLLLIIIGMFVYKDELIQTEQHDFYTCETVVYRNIAVEDGELVQKFFAEQDGLYTFFFWLDNCSNQDSGIIRTRLRDSKGKIYYENQYELGALGEGEFTWMGGTTNPLKKDKEYELIISIENAMSNASIRTVEGTGFLESIGEFYVYGEDKADSALWFLQSFNKSYSVASFWFILWIISVSVGIIAEFINRKVPQTIFSILICCWSIIAPVLIIELLNDSMRVITVKYIFINCLIIMAIYLIIHLFSYRWAKYAVLILSAIIGSVNYYVKQFRGSELQIADFKSASTAISIIENYHFTISWHIYTVLEIVVITIGLMIIADYRVCKYPKKSNGYKFRLNKLNLGCAICGIFLLIIINSVFVSRESFGWFDISTSFSKYGWCYSNMIIQSKMKIRKPDGYSDENIERIISSIEKDTPQANIIPQNIIVIMNESFSDLGILGNLETNQDYLPFIHSLEKNVVKGNLYVSTLGGNTAITEYEFLTGNTEHFFQNGLVPYTSLCEETEEGLGQILKAQDYCTVAMHPYDRKNWNRDKVYPAMGFDEFLSLEDYQGADHIRNYVSDKADYEKIIEYVENDGEGDKLFVFNVTMQNHGGYDIDNGKIDALVEIDNFDSKVAETYLSLIYESDKAFEYLIGFFSEFEEPTMIVMFGDHMPKLPDDVYNNIYGENYHGLSAEERNKMYITPFIIWTNYNAEFETRQMMSVNYLGSYLLEIAGLEMPDYNKFLCNLMDRIPVIGQYGYIDQNGRFTSYEDGDVPPLMSEYRMLQYMRVKDRKARYYNCFSIPE